ncbi:MULTISPECIES: response regulator transcription factor [Limnobacter]|nr:MULTISPECIES: response regulator transcription factor [Limnobacter]HEX5486262.1 response regulator transcription factor [Limnobacter sp.]
MSITNNLRVFIIDDHPILAMALRDIMNARYSDLDVKLFSRIGPALEHSKFEQPDLVLLDLGLPDMPPQKVLETALETFDYSRTLVLSGNEDILGDLAEANPETEFISKGITQDRVLSVLDSMVLKLRRNTWTEQIYPKENDGSGATVGQRMARITERQVSVLHRIAKGESNFEIAQNLGLSPETVKTHVRSILARLNARNRLEAAMLYRAWQEQRSDEVYSD